LRDQDHVDIIVFMGMNGFRGRKLLLFRHFS